MTEVNNVEYEVGMHYEAGQVHGNKADIRDHKMIKKEEHCQLIKAKHKKGRHFVTHTQTLRSLETMERFHFDPADRMPKVTQDSFRNNYKLSVIESKNDHWRRLCWSELQKKRTRTKLEEIELLDRFKRYDRWEMTDFTTVDWKRFYTEMRNYKSTVKGGDWSGDPIYLLCGVFFFMSILLYFVLASYY